MPDFSFHINLDLYEKVLLKKRTLGEDVPGNSLPYIKRFSSKFPLLAEILMMEFNLKKDVLDDVRFKFKCPAEGPRLSFF